MQDIHGILGAGSDGGGRGGPIFGDLRMRAPTQGLPQQQVLKCPRCDSSNTKFCYYNNYNLSQPRHFCKNCRRYWTNGGVLRNVPVGGGCRKNKRSSKRKADSPQATPSTAVNDREDKSNSHSSSESTSAGVRAEAASEKPPATKPNCSAISANFTPLNDHDGISTENSDAREIFSEIGGFPSFMSCNQNLNLFEFGSRVDAAPTPFKIHHQNQVNTQDPMVESWPMDKLDGADHWGAGALDQTVHLDLLPNNRTSDGGGVFASTDWRGDERRQVSNFFDLTPGSSAGHWGQSGDQWHESDHDQHLYLPP